MAIINSLLDTDLYKVTQGQLALHQFPNVWVKYKFKCRNEGIIWTPSMVDRVNKEINHFCTLQLTPDELDWVSKLRYIKKDFVEFLRIYRPQRQHVKVWNTTQGELNIEVEGPWFLTIYFEVPILAIVNEVYFEMGREMVPAGFFQEANLRLRKKIDIAAEEKFLFSDFGTRRRFSRDWQDAVIEQLTLHLPRNIFGGTSNMYLAKKYGFTPIGTMAHELMMVGQGLNNVTLAGSQKHMLQAWVDEYRGDLGYALSDTLGIDKFLRDFDLYFSKLYDGLRHDSGDEYEWTEKVLEHYERMRIDSRTKQLVYSNALTFERAANINRMYKDRAKLSFGIGTNLTNDMPGITPLNIVMKVVTVGGRPVAKISDSKGKLMCEDQGFIDYLRQVIKE
jgi:nicotinate phosphoribosyltransferase